jgi:carbonic anhydrase
MMTNTTRIRVVAVALAMAGASPALAQHAHPPATKSSAADACTLGTEQSPIHISSADARRIALPALAFDYHASKATVEHLGHAVQVNLKEDNELRLGDVDYELLQFHYHHPSEHLIDGKAAPLEVHLVHKNAAGNLAVVGVLFHEGAANPALATKLASIGEDATVDPRELLPADLGYFTYNGSLTTPPCSEGVKWLVLAQPMTASAEQIAALKKQVEPNARAVQKVNERLIERSMH